MLETLFNKLSSLKFSFIVVIVLLIASIYSNSHRTYAYGLPTIEQTKAGLSRCVGANGDLNITCSTSVILSDNLTLLSCLATSHVVDGQQMSGFCPQGLTNQTGFIPALAMTTQQFYDVRPANLALWLQDTGKTLGFIPKSAYAQGVGFSGLAPLLDIWKAFRNIAYTLLSIAIIIFGFMIMFRRKIDPQTVASIQEALPRIIICLILITFSYAIAALLIDLMYVILLVAYQLFLTSGALGDAPQIGGTPISIFGLELTRVRPLLDIILGGDLREAFLGVFPAGLGDLYTIASQLLHDGSSDGNIFQQAISGLIGGIIGGALVGFLLVILVAILFIRLFFLFLGAYIRIIFQVIFGPLYILLDVIPGNNNIAMWIKNIVANLSVFALSGILFMLTIAFQQRANDFGQSIWVPPYTSIGASLSSISSLFTIGVLLMLPNIVNQFREAIRSAGGPNLSGAFFGGLATSLGVLKEGWDFYKQEKLHHIIKDKAIRDYDTPTETPRPRPGGGSGHSG
jgi:hypothetical protein